MQKLEKVTLASGCFWCTEAVFERVKGVVGDVVSGYSGGTVKNPDYNQVSSGSTGHAEAVQFKFDPEIITYSKILEIFFKTHNPTTPNQQGNDIGPQYRSVVFYHSEDQKAVAEKVIKQIEEEGVYDNQIVTEVVEFKDFYRAEDYHQNYFKNNPNQGYCQVIINPKLAKFRKEFETLLKD